MSQDKQKAQMQSQPLPLRFFRRKVLKLEEEEEKKDES
jgi:hypothetical protein